MHSDARSQGGQHDTEGETAFSQGFSEPVTDDRKTTVMEESSQKSRKRKAEDGEKKPKAPKKAVVDKNRPGGVRNKPKSQK